MSELLKTKRAEAEKLLSQAAKEEKELAALSGKLAQLSQKVALLTASSTEKRVYAESINAATAKLTGHAPVIEITSAKAAKPTKAAKVAKPAKAAATPAAEAPAAPVVAEAAPVAVPAKETKAKKGKVAKAAKTTDKAAAPAKVAAAPKKAKTVASAEKPREAGGDKLPTLHERLRIVIGDDDVTIPQAIERLTAKGPGWLPDSKDLNAYISLALSTHTKDVFERVSRGVYKVRKEQPAVAAPKPPKKAGAAQKTNGTHSPSNGLEDLGANIKDNPFAGVAAA